MNFFNLAFWFLFLLPFSSPEPDVDPLAKRPDFSGNWKLNESKSKTGEFGVRSKVCLGWLAAFRTITVTQHTPYMAVDLANPIARTAYTRHQKLIFNGKETEAGFLGSMKQQSKTTWAADGISLHVNSTIGYPGVEVAVSEVWQLINKGKTIHIRTHSTSVFGENNTDLVYEKVE